LPNPYFSDFWSKMCKKTFFHLTPVFGSFLDWTLNKQLSRKTTWHKMTRFSRYRVLQLFPMILDKTFFFENFETPFLWSHSVNLTEILTVVNCTIWFILKMAKLKNDFFCWRGYQSLATKKKNPYWKHVKQKIWFFYRNFSITSRVLF